MSEGAAPSRGYAMLYLPHAENDQPIKVLLHWTGFSSVGSLATATVAFGWFPC